MGTEYILGTFDMSNKDNPNAKAGLCINEMSNRLQLSITSDLDDWDCFDAGVNIMQTTPEITPEEMMKIFIEGIKVCSYWMDDKDTQRLLKTIETYSI